MTAQTPASPQLPPEPKRTPGRDPDQIERDIEQSRRRLALTVDELSERVRPGNVAARLKDRARGLVVDEDGGLRINRVAPVAGVVVGLALLKAWRVRVNRPKSRSERIAAAVAAASEAARDALVARSAAARDAVASASVPAREALVSGADSAHAALTTGAEAGREHLTNAVSTVAAATDSAKDAAVEVTKGTVRKAKRRFRS